MKYYIIEVKTPYEYFCDPNFTEKVTGFHHTFLIENKKGQILKRQFDSYKETKNYIKKLKVRYK